MSRNGSGGYSLPNNTWNPAVNGVSATAADWQSLINDVSSALTQSVSADGQTPITGNLQLSNNRITGMAAGVNPNDAVNIAQFASSNTVSGYQKFPTGIIVQWVSVVMPNTFGAFTDFSWPIAFPVKIAAISLAPDYTLSSTGYISLTVTNRTESGARLYCSGAAGAGSSGAATTIIAIGY